MAEENEERPLSVHDEAALLASALSGAPDARRALVRYLTPVIHIRAAQYVARGRAGGRTGTRSDVDDLVQEVWAALLSDRQAALRRWRPDGGASLSTFVSMCAQRAIISHHRGGARLGMREQGMDSADLERAVAVRSNAEDRMVNIDLVGQLIARLQSRLSARGRHVLRLLFFEEAATAEIQAQLGMTRGAVYTWRRDIRSHARQILVELSRTGGGA